MRKKKEGALAVFREQNTGAAIPLFHYYSIIIPPLHNVRFFMHKRTICTKITPYFLCKGEKNHKQIL